MSIKIFGIICLLATFELSILIYLKELFNLNTQYDTKDEIINKFKIYIINLDQKTIDEIYNILLIIQEQKTIGEIYNILLKYNNMKKEIVVIFKKQT